MTGGPPDGTCDGILKCLPEADINQSGRSDPICEAISIGDISCSDQLPLHHRYDRIIRRQVSVDHSGLDVGMATDCQRKHKSFIPM